MWRLYIFSELIHFFAGSLEANYLPTNICPAEKASLKATYITFRNDEVQYWEKVIHFDTPLLTIKNEWSYELAKVQAY